MLNNNNSNNNNKKPNVWLVCLIKVRLLTLICWQPQPALLIDLFFLMEPYVVFADCWRHTHTHTRAGLWHRVRFSSGWVTDLISGPQTCWLIICMPDRRSFLLLDVHYMSSSRCVNINLLLLMNANPARKRTKEGFTFNDAPAAAADLEWKRILCRRCQNFIEILQQSRCSLHFYSEPPPPCLETTNRKCPKWSF